MSSSDSNGTCFVISPIGPEDSAIREHADKMLDHVIGPVARELGYEPQRADDIAEPGIITNQVVEQVVDAPLVVADLTDQNPNVFYELALRHAIRKPVVQFIAQDQSIPFDVGATRTIHVDLKDLDSVERAKEDMRHQVRSMDPGDTEIETPISVSLDLQELRRSSQPEERQIGKMMELLQDIGKEITHLRDRIDEIDHQVGAVAHSVARGRTTDPQSSSIWPLDYEGSSSSMLSPEGAKTPKEIEGLDDETVRRVLKILGEGLKESLAESKEGVGTREQYGKDDRPEE